MRRLGYKSLKLFGSRKGPGLSPTVWKDIGGRQTPLSGRVSIKDNELYEIFIVQAIGSVRAMTKQDEL